MGYENKTSSGGRKAKYMKNNYPTQEKITDSKELMTPEQWNTFVSCPLDLRRVLVKDIFKL